MSLDTKDKLLTGRKFLKMTSRPGFFNSGKTKASFQISGKHPDCNELLTIFVRTGRRSSHLLTSVDGIGSRGQDLRAEFWISCLTSRTDSIVKVGNGGTVSSADVVFHQQTKCLFVQERIYKNKKVNPPSLALYL